MDNTGDTTIEFKNSDTTVEVQANTINYSEKTIVLSEKNFEKNIDRAEKIAREIANKRQRSPKENNSSNFKDFFRLSNSNIVTMFDKTIDVEEHLSKTSQPKTATNIEAIYEISSDTDRIHNIHDDFEIVSKLAEGGQGLVSSAVDKRLGRIIAVKSLHESLCDNENARNNFIAEAKITAQLDHPGVVSVYSLATDDKDGLHLAMKLVNGETFSDYIFKIVKNYRKHGIKKFDEKKSIIKRLNIVIKACEAIAYAHSRNVMHCDLKPDNIMIGDYGETYIMDWGIAKLIKNVNQEVMPSKVTAGTPQYFAPEILHRHAPDQRADIYTMGVILFEAIYLKKAFEGDNEKEILSNVKNYRVNSFKHAFKYPISKELTAVIKKAMAYDPCDRYQNMKELIDDLRRYLNNEATKALPDSTLDKIVRWSSNHSKTLLFLIFISILSCLILGGVSIHNHNKAAREILQQEIALSNAYSKNLAAASLVNLQMGYVEDSVKFISSSVGFLLANASMSDNDRAPLYFNSNKTIENIDSMPHANFNKFYGKYVNMAELGYLLPQNISEDAAKKKLDTIQLLLPSLQKIMRKSDITLTENERQTKKIANGIPPIFMLYFGFENGLFVTYPGFIQEMKTFNPVKRSWYINAINDCEENQAIWSVPYSEAVTKKLTVSCSAPILVNNRKVGVFGADLTLSAISSLLRKHGNPTIYAREKMIVNSDGVILVSTVMNYENDTEEESFEQKNFQNKRVFNIIKYRQSGYYLNTEHERKYVYVFSYIPQLNWYYVEKLNYEVLMDVIRIEKEANEN